ncbi:hypothetical protein [Nocardia tengchongensis]
MWRPSAHAKLSSGPFAMGIAGLRLRELRASGIWREVVNPEAAAHDSEPSDVAAAATERARSCTPVAA